MLLFDIMDFFMCKMGTFTYLYRFAGARARGGMQG